MPIPVDFQQQQIYNRFKSFSVGSKKLHTYQDIHDIGGDSRHVQSQLMQGVDTIYSNSHAFAARMLDGSIVTWGVAFEGGDSSMVQAQLKNVDAVYATDKAFAALLSNGSVVTWGDPINGGDSSGVQQELKQGVNMVYSTAAAFAASMIDGSVVTWGHPG